MSEDNGGLKNKRELKTLFSNTIMLYIMQISAYIFPLITFPWLTRSLGPEKYGVVNFANAIIVYFQLFVDFGFILSATRDCSIHRDDKKKLSMIASSVVEAKMLISFVGFTALLGIIGVVEAFRENAVYLIFCYISVFLSVFIPDYLFRGLEKMSSLTYRSIISRAIYTVLVISLVHSPNDYLLIPIFNAISNLFIVIWSWLIVVKKFKIHFSFVPLKNALEALKSSSMFFLSRIATTVYSASNVFILGFVVSDAVMGQFSAANNLITNGKSMFSPIADSLYPYMVTKKNYRLVKIILAITIPVILIGTAVLYFAADWFILFFCGEGYEGAVPVFRAMLPMMLITLPEFILGFPTLGAMNMMKEANLTVIYAAIFHAIGLAVLFFTNNLTLIAVSFLTCVSESVVLISRIIYVMKGLKKNKQRSEESLD